MKVVWTDQAIERLFEIEDFIAQDSPNRATTFVDRLLSRSEELAQQKLLGRVVPEFGDKDLRELIEGNYRIVYRVSKQVEVLTVFEGHREFPKEDIQSI